MVLISRVSGASHAGKLCENYTIDILHSELHLAICMTVELAVRMILLWRDGGAYVIGRVECVCLLPG